MSSTCPSWKIPHDRLREFVAQLLRSARLSEADAKLVADSLVEASLRGIDSHGVARLPHYLNRLAHGSINPEPSMKFERLAPSCGRVDGDHALGQLVMWRAAEESIALARESGAGWVSVCNSTHCGTLDYFGLKIAEAGMVGLVFTHVDSMVLPFGSKKAFCGTNPICITAPAEGNRHLCLDMATSAMPWNQVANAALENLSIPAGLAVDAGGNETTDPNAVSALYPVGGYKGSGLGLLIDVLCAMLSGAPFGPDIPKMYGDPTERRRLGGLVGAIDIARFVPLNVFRARVSELMQRWNDLPACEAQGRVLYPGEPELIARAGRVKDGIPIPKPLFEKFEKLAKQFHLPLSYVASQ